MTRRGASFVQMTLYQFRELYRNKIALFFNLMFPLLLVVIFGTLFNPSDRPAVTPVGFDDEHGGEEAALVARAMSESGLYALQRGEAASLEKELRNGRIRAVIVIPPGLRPLGVVSEAREGATAYPTAISNGPSEGTGPEAIEIVHDPLSPASSRTAVELGMFLNGLGVRMTGVQPAFVTTTRPVSGVAQRDVFDYLMPGMMTVMILASGLMTVSVTVADQRSSGALRHLFSTPLPVSVWTAARIAANLLMALVQGLLLFSFARAVFGVSAPANVVGTVVVVAVSSLTVLGVGLLIGTHAKNDDTAVAVSMPIMMLLMFLGNAAMPLEDPPAFIAAVLPWMPTFHMTEAMRAVMRDGQGLASVGGELLLLSGLALVLFGLALWRMRRQYVLLAD